MREAVREQRSTAFVALHGEPGIGKTTLLHALADLAREERVRVTDALDDLRPPVVAIVDDLSDEDAETLATLLRKPPGGGVLIAFAYRRAPAALFSALESAARRGLLIDLPLTPLRAEEMAGYPPALQRLSGGNPFYLTELAGHARGVPPKIVASVQEEVAALSAPARTLVHGAAVAGEDLDLALAAAGLEEDLAALDEAISAGLLKGSGRRYRFRHPIVRRAVYEGTGPGWRLAAHARTADALKSGRAQDRAHHLERCAKAGDEEAIAVLVEAAGQARPEVAARWYAAAQRLRRDRRRSLLVPLADALAATGRLEHARSALQEALSLVPGDQRLIAATATCEHLLGRHAAAHARLSALPEHDLAQLVDAVYQPDYVALKSRAKRAAAQDPFNAVPWALLALAHGTLGELSTAEEALQEAVAIVDATPDEQLTDAAYYLALRGVHVRARRGRHPPLPPPGARAVPAADARRARARAGAPGPARRGARGGRAGGRGRPPRPAAVLGAGRGGLHRRGDGGAGTGERRGGRSRLTRGAARHQLPHDRHPRRSRRRRSWRRGSPTAPSSRCGSPAPSSIPAGTRCSCSWRRGRKQRSGGRRWRRSGSGKPPRWRSRFRCGSRATGSCSRRPR